MSEERGSQQFDLLVSVLPDVRQRLLDARERVRVATVSCAAADQERKSAIEDLNKVVREFNTRVDEVRASA